MFPHTGQLEEGNFPSAPGLSGAFRIRPHIFGQSTQISET